jgi:DNA-binding transcriptional LysR family regulator
VTPADVIDEDWITPPPGYPIDRVLSAIAARAGSPARVVRRTMHLPLMETLVARGHGIALLPRHTTRERAEGRLALVPLADLRAGRFVEALLRPDRAARRAVAVVLEALVAEAAPYAA